MVQVKGSSGKLVSIELTGIGEVLRRIRQTGKDIENNVDLAVVKAGAFVEDEVKESIIGNRDEHKSVDTGLFGNSIQANKKGNAHMEIAPKNMKYPNGQTTTQIATYMEFGTSKITPRRHFRNTAKRVKPSVLEEINKAVKKATK